MIKIYNKDCFETIDTLLHNNSKVNMILTSPPYNVGKHSNRKADLNNYDGKYDIYMDAKTPQEYIKWCVDLFNKFDDVLLDNGVILWNMSYGSNSKVNKDSNDVMWILLAELIKNTNFTIADRIIWKKKSALPNNSSPNKLTRIVEDVFVFVRNNEYTTYYANKPLTSISKSGQKFYGSKFNFIEAKNNDGVCPYNKATFSTDLVLSLFDLYVPESARNENYFVFDPFMGSGTTLCACEEYGVSGIGSEISENQCDWASKRLHGTNIKEV